MKLKEGFILRQVAGKTVVLPCDDALDLNVMITLNGTGAFLWEHLQAETTQEELVAALLGEYDVDEETARNSVAAFVEKGGFDIGGFGRTIFAYPDFAKDILKNGGMDPKKICICCSKCTHIMRTPGGTPGCVIRDADTYLPIYKQQCGGK